MMAECSRGLPTRPPQPRREQARDTQPSTATQLSVIKECHDKAYKYIRQGLDMDEAGKGEQAQVMYKKGIENLNRGIEIHCTDTSPDGEKATQMQNKMTKTRLQIQQRIQDLRPNEASAMHSVELPSYEDATSGPNASAAWADDIMNDNESMDSNLVANAQVVFSIAEEVQTYYITSEGYVSAPSYPSALRLYKFTERTNSNQPQAFIQVGDWTYPLSPGSSPVLCTSDHVESAAYIFPDITTPGAAVGLILPPTTTEQEKTKLDSLLKSLTALETRQVTVVNEQPGVRVMPINPEGLPHDENTSEEKTSTKVADGVMTAATWISWGLSKGAEKTGQLIKYGSEKVREKWKPESEPAKIDPKYQKGVKIARDTTDVAVKVSGFIVSNLCKATVALGKQLAPHIREQGSKLLSKSSMKNKVDDSKIDDVLEVAASGVKAFGTVYTGLETAAIALFKNVASETVNIVSHKYGNEAGALADNALYAAGNTGLAYHNVSNLGVKAIAKRAAKDTGKEVVKDIVENRKLGKERKDGST